MPAAAAATAIGAKVATAAKVLLSTAPIWGPKVKEARKRTRERGDPRCLRPDGRICAWRRGRRRRRR